MATRFTMLAALLPAASASRQPAHRSSSRGFAGRFQAESLGSQDLSAGHSLSVMLGGCFSAIPVLSQLG